VNAEDAFIPSQDPKPFFDSGPASMVLTQLERGLEDASPIVVLTGESGVGKSTVVREALGRWGSRVTPVWFEIEAGAPPEKTLLKTIRAFGGHGRAKDERPELIARMAHALRDVTQRGSTPILIVDDAHKYDIAMLAEVGRIESAAIAADQNLKLLLVGEPGLTDLLEREELEVLAQRVALFCRLEPMEQADTRQYLNQRLGATSPDAANAFSRKAAREIHQVTRGVPSAINALAEEARRRAKASSSGVVTPDHVRSAMSASRRPTGQASPAPIALVPPVKPQAAAPAAPTPSGSIPRPASSSPSGQTRRPNVEAALPPSSAPRSATPNAPGGPKQHSPVPPRVKRVPPPPAPVEQAAPPEPVVDASHPRVKEWVSRFTDGQPLRIGGANPPPPITDPSTIPDMPVFADEEELLLPPSEVPVPPAEPAQQAPPDEFPLPAAPPVVAAQPPVAQAPVAQPPVEQPPAAPEPHAVELPPAAPLVSPEALTPPPLVLAEKPAEATPSGSMKKPATLPSATNAPAAPAASAPASSAPPSAPPQVPAPQASEPPASPPKLPATPKASQVARASGSQKHKHGGAPQHAKGGQPKAAKSAPPPAPKPAPVVAQQNAPPETPTVLTKKDVKAHKPAEQKKPAAAPPPKPAPAATTTFDDDDASLPSPAVYRVLAALIPIVLILGMAATAIVLSRRSAFDRDPQTDLQAATTTPAPAATESVQSVPVAPPAPAPPPLVVTPETEVKAAPAEQARYCLSVGTYLFSDRARERTEQLMRRTHMHSWIITTTADGSYTYRVMLGGFVTQAEAERAADKLLSSGLVSEALVERMPKR
jgi:type II secretory pathway predicted ATPase ExeA